METYFRTEEEDDAEMSRQQRERCCDSLYIFRRCLGLSHRDILYREPLGFPVSRLKDLPEDAATIS